MGLKWFSDVGPFAAMVMVILAQVSSMVAVKAALSQGMDKYVIMVYTNTICVLILFPCSIISHRSASSRPPVTFNILCGFILIAVLGVLGQMCGYAGIQYSSPTFGTALLNIIPAFTFILAIVFRMEKIHWRSSSSQAKVVGTVVSIAGAFVVTLYKGPPMMNNSFTTPTYQLVSQQSNWIFGGFLLAAEALMISVSYIVKALVLEKYPAQLLMLLYTFGFGTILSTISCLILVKDSSAWRLRLDMRFAILCAALATLVSLSLLLWCLSKTGPLYVSMFKPLAILFAAVMSVVFLEDVLCLGSLIGSVIIVVGFYVVMWGKANEKEIGTEMENGAESSVSPSNKLPLLQNKIEDI